MTAGPLRGATESFDAELERLRRLAGLQVDTVARAVQGVGDTAGWDRLTALGTSATVDAQHGAKAATTRYLEATLDAAGVPSAGVSVPIRPGLTVSGRPVSGMFAATQGVVRNRMTGGDTFDEALDHSAHYLVGQAASEPHRIGRDGQLAVGLTDERFGRFRRVAEPGACPWCRMLATRGAVYLTAQTAGEHRRYHDHCRCGIVLEVSPDAIAESKSLSGDWRNAIRDEERMRQAGAIIPGPGDWAARQSALGIQTHGETLHPHEIEFVERFLALGHTAQWIPRDPLRRPTNDFIWAGQGPIEVEVKATRARFESIRSRITDAVSKAAKQGVVKANFIIDLGEEEFTEELVSRLADFNRGRTRHPIKGLWLMSRGQLYEVRLNE